MKRPSSAATVFRVAAAAAAALALAGCAERRENAEQDWVRLPDDAGVRMLSYVEEFVRNSPRDAGTIGGARASRAIAQELLRMGVRPEVDCWTESTA
ncbi:MAG: hypothetical protein IJS46_01345 [Kiritimatiellae bacterium]|nr:hypothetical protein [Kiritimatiellia bacterium]